MGVGGGGGGGGGRGGGGAHGAGVLGVVVLHVLQEQLLVPRELITDAEEKEEKEEEKEGDYHLKSLLQLVRGQRTPCPVSDTFPMAGVPGERGPTWG